MRRSKAVAAAALVHVLTVSGVLCSLFAFQSVYSGNDFTTAFAWLGLALFVDAIDGPLARRARVLEYLPRFSGERLDLIIDYINYVLIPTFIFMHSDLVGDGFALLAAALMLTTSLFHFSDIHSKTKDNYFVGYPAVWNLVVFYLLAFRPEPKLTMAVVLILSAATFIPMKWIHPLRVKRLRLLTIAVCLFWAVAAIRVLYLDFQIGLFEQIILLVSLAYLLTLGFARSMHN